MATARNALIEIETQLAERVSEFAEALPSPHQAGIFPARHDDGATAKPQAHRG